jgi:hypothetical protein
VYANLERESTRRERGRGPLPGPGGLHGGDGAINVIKRAREAPSACLHQQLLKQKSGRLDTLKRQAVLI